MKFTILTPALLAALAASANAVVTYTTNDSSSCTTFSNTLLCASYTTETTCDADTANKCSWSADDEECNTDESDVFTDWSAVGNSVSYSVPYATCLQKAEADCSGDCAWQASMSGSSNTCGLSESKTSDIYTTESAPKGLKAMAMFYTFHLVQCGPKTDQATCDAVAGCEWDSEESACGATDQKRYDIGVAECGSEGNWAAAAAATPGVTASGAADSASRFAVLAASAVAAASLLA